MFRTTGRILAAAFKLAYERIGLLMAGNLLWFALALWPTIVVLTLQLRLPFLVTAAIVAQLLFFGPATAAYYAVLYGVIKREDAELLRDFRFHFRRFFGRGFLISLIMGLLGVILVANIMFSVSQGSTVWRLLSGVWIYLLVFLVVMAQYVFPFLVQRQESVLNVLKKSALLVMDNLALSLLLTVAAGVLFVISVFLGVPLLLFFTGLLAYIQHFTFREVMQKYE